MTNSDPLDETPRERIVRLETWVARYRSLPRLGGTIHTVGPQEEGQPFASVSVDDVEWLLRVAKLAGAAAAEARAEMRKGHAGSFEADFPATAELAQIVLLGDGAR